MMKLELNVHPGRTVLEFDSPKEFDVTTSGEIIVYDWSDNQSTQRWFLRYGSARIKAQKMIIDNVIKLGFSVYLTEVQ